MIMNRFVLIVLAAISFLLARAQNGYYYGSSFIKLEPDTTMYYVQKGNSLSSHEIYVKSHSQLLKERKSGLPDVGSMDKNRKADNYTSCFYKTASVSNIIVLPQISVCADRQTLSNVLYKYSDQLSFLKKVSSDIYYLNSSLKTSAEVLELVNKIVTEPGVVWCEPNMYSGITSTANPLYKQQYYLNNTGQFGWTKGLDINVEPAWQLTQANAKIKIAVVDTGIDLTHEDLKDCIGEGYTVGNPNGLGAPQNWTTQNDKAHGTACAGIIGALDNEIGIKGIASGATIIPVNIAPNLGQLYNGQVYNTFASNQEISEAIRWAYKRADILSCSWGGGAYSNEIAAAIQEARVYGRNGKGCVVIFASGNNGSGVSFPASVDGVIAVGAVDGNGKRYSYSNYGSELDLVAPSAYDEKCFMTTDFSGSYGYEQGNNYTLKFNGTSAACPQVAGVAALVLSADSTLTGDGVSTLLKTSARDLGTRGKDSYYGYGLVDAYKAILAIRNKMQIIGPNIIDDKATYSVNNLPAGAKVTWQYVDKSTLSSCYPNLNVGYPTSNEITISNFAKQVFYGALEAVIKVPNSQQTYIRTKDITGDGPLIGVYQEIYSDGSKSYDRPLTEDQYDLNFADVGSEVVIYSDNFRNRYVSCSEGRCDVVDNAIVFYMPNLEKGKTVDFKVSGGGVSSVLTFKFVASNSTLLNKDFLLKKVSDKVFEMDGQDFNFGTKSDNILMEICNVQSGTVQRKKITYSDRMFLDLSHLFAGTYIIKLKYNNLCKSTKITIK